MVRVLQCIDFGDLFQGKGKALYPALLYSSCAYFFAIIASAMTLPCHSHALSVRLYLNQFRKRFLMDERARVNNGLASTGADAKKDVLK